MRWNLCYCLMIACMASALALVVYAAPTPLSVSKLTASNSTMLTPPAGKRVVMSPSSAAIVHESAKIESSQARINAGASRNDVIAALGNPVTVDDLNNRWTYGSQVIFFKNDRVAGCVSVDPAQAMRIAESQITKSMNDASLMKAKPARKRVSPNRTAQAKAKGRTGAGRATPWESMFRHFNSDKPLPRAVSHTSRRFGTPQYRNNRYFNPNSMYQRR